MADLWEERKKAIENEYFYKEERRKIEAQKRQAREEFIRIYGKNRCPKCGDEIEPITFHGVPMDKCPGCGRVWLGPKDFETLAQKDHRTWFDKWFQA
jgi:hypothetical protein